MIRKGLYFALLLLGQSGATNAQFLDEGCDVLADVVQRSIAGRTTLAAPFRMRSEFGFFRCSSTAVTATQAFTESMRQLRIPVRWESPGIAPGDVCLSHDIRQCYPRGGSYSDSGLPGSDQFMRHTWNAIQSSLQLTIQKDHSPDVSVFQTGTLERTVSYQLGRTTHLAGSALFD